MGKRQSRSWAAGRGCGQCVIYMHRSCCPSTEKCVVNSPGCVFHFLSSEARTEKSLLLASPSGEAGECIFGFYAQGDPYKGQGWSGVSRMVGWGW